MSNSQDSMSTIEAEIARKGSIVSRNVGDSMWPLIRQDIDLIYIEKYEGGLKKYDVPLYKRDSGQYVLHRCLSTKKGYIMCGDNRAGREHGIEDRHIIGVLKGVYRGGTKFVPVTDWRYKLYVHIWCDFYYVRAFIIKVHNKLRKMFR